VRTEYEDDLDDPFDPFYNDPSIQNPDSDDIKRIQEKTEQETKELEELEKEGEDDVNTAYQDLQRDLYIKSENFTVNITDDMASKSDLLKKFKYVQERDTIGYVNVAPKMKKKIVKMKNSYQTDVMLRLLDYTRSMALSKFVPPESLLNEDDDRFYLCKN
jgi:hypothetical protein